MPNPVADLVAALTGNTAGYDALGAARYVVLLVFYALVFASLTLFVVNLRDDRTQRRGSLLWVWFTRLLVGCLWFQAMLSTLPFGLGNGFHALVEQMADRAATPEIGRFVTDAVLPRFGIVGPLAFLATFGLAASFMLGLFARLAGFGTLVAGVVLWLGLYAQRPADPAAWPWGFLGLALLGGYLAVFAAGRAMGADAWIRRNVASVRDRRPSGLLLRLLT